MVNLCLICHPKIALATVDLITLYGGLGSSHDFHAVEHHNSGEELMRHYYDEAFKEDWQMARDLNHQDPSDDMANVTMFQVSCTHPSCPVIL